MNLFKRKLQSKRGASMLLAMVFMLFCVMVGGTVLSSSAASGYRMNRIESSQKELNQRSAAMMIAQQVRGEEDTKLQMTISDVIRTIQPVKLASNGQETAEGTAETVRLITVSLPVGLELTPVQRIMVEATVWQYMKQVGATEAAEVVLYNFVYDNGGTTEAVTDMEQFWYQYELLSEKPIDGTMNISGDLEGAAFGTQDVRFVAGAGEDLYDFSFDFGKDGVVRVMTEASYDTQSPESNTYVAAYRDGYARISAEWTNTVIVWDNPVIEKGGN